MSTFLYMIIVKYHDCYDYWFNCICIKNCLQRVKLFKNVSKHFNKTCHTCKLSRIAQLFLVMIIVSSKNYTILINGKENITIISSSVTYYVYTIML